MLLDESVLFDLGPGGLKNLVTRNFHPDQLSRVFISHTHADHISDLVPFLWTIQICGRARSLEVYGPPGFTEILEMLLKCTATPEGFFKFPLSISELDFGQRVGNISTCRASHSIPTLAFRVESSGRSFCYSADTVQCEEVIDLAHEADLLLHEATFTEDQREIADLTRHSTAKSAGTVAQIAEVNKLVLFHIPPPNEHREEQFLSEARSTFDGEVVVAGDLMSFDI